MEVKNTITRLFMAPTVGILREYFAEHNLINAFYKDEMRDIEYEDAIYLLFRPKDFDKFRSFVDQQYENNNLLIDDYDYPNGFVVLVYKLDADFKEDFNIVRRGKYSKTSKMFQDMFPKEVSIVKNNIKSDVISTQFRIFNKTEDLVKFWEEKFDIRFEENQEVWSGFNLAEETLTEEKLKRYSKR